jgi:hypothetical protein
MRAIMRVSTSFSADLQPALKTAEKYAYSHRDASVNLAIEHMRASTYISADI